MSRRTYTSGVYAERDMMLTVRALIREAEGALSIDLVRSDGAPMPPWEPGAHLEIDVPGIGVRHYSLCGTPKDRSSWRIAVRLADISTAAASAYFHGAVAVGDEFHVYAPRNNFRFVLPEAGETLHLVAGGIGITPILPMAAAAEAAGIDWSLAYYGRSPETMPFTGILAEYGDRVGLMPRGHLDRLSIDAFLDSASPGGSVYSCGPAAMISDVEDASTRRGLRHRSERFSFSGSSAQRDDDVAFSLECRASGLLVDVGAAETIVEALERVGVPTRTSCRIGVCGTCETRVLAGIPDHRDSLLNEEEQQLGETMMVCVGRAQGDRLAVDL